MLFILHKGNHPDIIYSEGQGPIVHLQAEMRKVIQWADNNGSKWAFTDRNAGDQLVKFYRDLHELSQVNWNAIEATDFKPPLIKIGKQAEFLIHTCFPWELVERIGVLDKVRLAEAQEAIAGAVHRPLASVTPDWYY